MSKIKFLQIGTELANDHVFNFVKDKDIELGVLVEPLKEYEESIMECYKGFKNIHLEQVAVRHDHIKEEKFFTSELHTGIGSFNRKHLITHRIPSEKIKTRTVNCININDLFDKYKLYHLDHFFIDTEGFDANILLELNLSKYQIDHIVFEYVHLDGSQMAGGPKTMKLLNYLKSHGYTISNSESKFNMEARLNA